MTPRVGRATRRVVALATVIALWGAAPATAQSPATPRVGVVLSGGSAKGLAHIGVLRVLEEAGIPISIVTGTSMGALIGGLYAIGYTPAELDRLVWSLDWPLLFSDVTERRLLGIEGKLADSRTFISLPLIDGRVQLPNGAIAGQRISDLLTRLTWPAHEVRNFGKLPRSFAAIATDLEHGTVAVLDTGSLAEAMRASISLPSVFQPVRVHGQLMVDGYVVRNLPAQDARALGATIVICSDVGDPLYKEDALSTLVDILNQTLTIQGSMSGKLERQQCDLVIEPNVRGLSALSFDQAEQWVARGDSATRALLPQVKAIAATLRAGGVVATRPPAMRGVPSTITVDSTGAFSMRAQLEVPRTIREIRVPGLTVAAERLVRQRLQLTPPVIITADVAEDAIQRVYATGLFSRVVYTVEPLDSALELVVRAYPTTSDQFGLGLRYDNRYSAAVLFTSTFRNWLTYGSTTRLDVRLGEQFQVNGQFLRSSSLDNALIYGALAGYTQTPMDFFQGSRRVAQATARAINATVLAGTVTPFGGGVALTLGLESSGGEASIALTDSSLRRSYTLAGLLYTYDSFDRANFPTRGVKTMVHGLIARGEARFTHLVADWSGVWPLSSALAWRTRLLVGATNGGEDVPLQYNFFLGGMNLSGVFAETQLPFAGLAPQERLGRAVQMVSNALQFGSGDRIFSTWRVDVGRTSNQLDYRPGEMVVGSGLSLGALTPFGPVEATISGRTRRVGARLDVRVGYTF